MFRGVNKAGFLVLALVAGGLIAVGGVRVASRAGVVAPLAPRLSETGLYAAGRSDELGPGVRAYTPRYPLWSDGASKRRWLRLPEGAQIDQRDPQAWQFPVGTRFWKEFSFGERVETRYMERLPGGSYRYASYVWDEARGDAFLVPNEGRVSAKQIAPGVQHDIPTESDCRACHEGRRSEVLGYTAVQLEVAELDASSATEREAFGYFQGNCAYCHNALGPLASLGLDLDAAGTGGAERVRRSVLGRESKFRLPGEERSLRVSRAEPKHSALWFRMQSRLPAAQMPPLGTKLVDARGVALVEGWIRSL